MKDSLDILRTDYTEEDSITHYGVKGMKWGVRKKYVSLGVSGRTASQKINSLINANKGVHRRGSGLSTGPVGGGSYPTSIEGGAITSSGNMSEKELVALHNKTIDDIRKTTYYSEIFKLAEELKKLQDDRKINLGQGNLATEMVYEAKSDRIIEQINSKLKSIDDTFAKETSLIKNFDRDFSPSKWVLSDLSEKKSVSAALGLNRSTGRVSKGWSNDRVSVSRNSKGYAFKRK